MAETAGAALPLGGVVQVATADDAARMRGVGRGGRLVATRCTVSRNVSIYTLLIALSIPVSIPLFLGVRGRY